MTTTNRRKRKLAGSLDTSNRCLEIEIITHDSTKIVFQQLMFLMSVSILEKKSGYLFFARVETRPLAGLLEILRSCPCFERRAQKCKLDSILLVILLSIYTNFTFTNKFGLNYISMLKLCVKLSKLQQERLARRQKF